MKRIRTLLLIAGVMMTLTATPAWGSPDSGAATGEMWVGSSGTCASSPGLGLGLLPSGSRSYAIHADVHFVAAGPVELHICGELGSSNGIGATCAVSTGRDGTGTLGSRAVSDWKWPFMVGNVLLMTGDLDGGDENVLAPLAIDPASACLASPVFTIAGPVMIFG